ncbi:hypothetical protein I6E29_00775 [Arcanobacterium haemolyticum]|nr:hypothetical protein [Arcanobacterium haemolyticum]
MTVELVTGKAGVPHISSEDMGLLYRGTFGAGEFNALVLQRPDGSYPELTIVDANHVRVPVMELLVDGRFVRVSQAETATITSGQSGMNRKDYVCVKYTRNVSTGVESASIEVLRGTPTSGTAGPPMASGRIINGSSVAYYPIAQVRLQGITPTKLLMVAEKFAPLTGRSSAKTFVSDWMRNWVSNPPFGQVSNSGQMMISSEKAWRHVAPFNSEPLGRNNIDYNGSSRFVALIDGVYELTASAVFSYEGGSNGWRGLGFSRNGSKDGPETFVQGFGGNSGSYVTAPTYYVHLRSGDQVGLMAWQDSGTQLSLYNYVFTCRYVRPIYGDDVYIDPDEYAYPY